MFKQKTSETSPRRLGPDEIFGKIQADTAAPYPIAS